LQAAGCALSWYYPVSIIRAPQFCAEFHVQVGLIDIHSKKLSASKILNDLRTFWRRFWRYSQAYVGFDRVNHRKSIFITTENHHAGKTFMLAPTFFLGPSVLPSQFFHSRIATGVTQLKTSWRREVYFQLKVQSFHL